MSDFGPVEKKILRALIGTLYWQPGDVRGWRSVGELAHYCHVGRRNVRHHLRRNARLIVVREMHWYAFGDPHDDGRRFRASEQLACLLTPPR
jgi:hypothetical protein